MQTSSGGTWWIPLLVCVLGLGAGAVGWLWNRLIKRIDSAHDGVFADGGPVANVRQELTTIRKRVEGCMTREEGERNNEVLRDYLDTIRLEAQQREQRLMEAIASHGDRTTNDLTTVRSDIRALSQRVDAISDRYRR